MAGKENTFTYISVVNNFEHIYQILLVIVAALANISFRLLFSLGNQAITNQWSL